MKAHPYKLDCECEVCVEMRNGAFAHQLPIAPVRIIPVQTYAEVADPVSHPKHYTSHPSGVECITITEHYCFNLGNVIKYLWRQHLKGSPVEDLKKARWYLDREIANREKVTTGERG